MKNFQCIIIFILCTSALNLTAQPYVDLANIEFNRFNQAPMKGDMNATLDQWICSGSFFLPLPLKHNNRLIIGADNSTHTLIYNGNDTSITAHLSSTSMQIGLLKQWKNPKWNTLLMFIPRQAADFKDTYTSDRQLGGAIINTYVKRSNLKFKFGLYYNREFFGNYFMPLLGLDWKVNEKINIWGLLPGSMNFNYKLNKILSCGIRYQSITVSFRPQGNDGSNYIREGDDFYGDQQLSLNTELKITKNLVFYAGAGMSVFHYFQEFNKFHNKTYTLPEFQPARDRGFLYIGLSFRVYTD